MPTEDTILKALDKPRMLFSILAAVDPGRRQDSLRDKLMQMRDRGQVRFNIKKGTWSRFIDH